MSDSSYTQASFLGGEVSPFAQGHSDKPEYRTEMNVCRNAFPIEEGAWVRRPGTWFIATTLNGGRGRAIKFDFEQTAPYHLELTDGAMRFYGVSTQAGGLATPLPSTFRLVTTGDNQQVLAISTANPAVVQTTSATTWATGDQALFLFGTVAAANQTPLLCNRVFALTKIDTTHFALSDPISGQNIDGSTLNWDATIAAGATVIARILNKPTVYVSGTWSSVRAVQAETEAFLLHGSYQPYALAVTTLPTAGAFAQFSLGAASFTDGPYLDPPTDGSTLTANGTSGAITLTANSAASINGGSGFVATDVGRLVRLLSEPALWASGTAYVVGNTAKFNGAYFSCIQANTGQQPDIAVAYWAISTTAATWSWATITALTSNLVVSAMINGATLVNTLAMTTWRMGVYSNTTGWPTCGVYYEGRLALSGAVSNRVDFSVASGVVGSVINMTPTAADGTVADSNAISYIFNASDVNPIYWMIGTSSGIICGTLAGEWVIQASQLSDPITPTSIQAHRVTKYGCANIEPQHSDLTLCFVHRYNRKVLEYFPDVFSGKYNAPNLSQKAKHLTTTGIEEIRFQQELVPILWARCGNGSFIGATYKRSSLFSSQGPEFVGWHRHDLGSLRTVESIAVGASADGTLDTLAMVTKGSGATRHFELMNSLFDVDDTITEASFLDNAIVPSGGVLSGTTLTLYGLWHLNGKKVTAWVGGMDAGDYTVSSGSIAVSIDTDPLNPDTLTSAYLQSIASPVNWDTLGMTFTQSGINYTVPCVVGFTFTSQGQVLRPDAIEQNRSPTGPGAGKVRRHHQFAMLLKNTQGLSVGTNLANPAKMHALQFKSLGGTAYHKTQLFSGVYQDTVDDTGSYDGMLCWQVTRPYPASLVALTGFLNMQDK